jgi:hypothetical protein
MFCDLENLDLGVVPDFGFWINTEEGLNQDDASSQAMVFSLDSCSRSDLGNCWIFVLPLSL